MLVWEVRSLKCSLAPLWVELHACMKYFVFRVIINTFPSMVVTHAHLTLCGILFVRMLSGSGSLLPTHSQPIVQVTYRVNNLHGYWTRASIKFTITISGVRWPMHTHDTGACCLLQDSIQNWFFRVTYKTSIIVVNGHLCKYQIHYISMWSPSMPGYEHLTLWNVVCANFEWVYCPRMRAHRHHVRVMWR